MKSKLVAITLGVFIAAATGATGDAHALIFCAKKGQPDRVRVRGGDTCKENETPVQLEVPPGPEGPKGEKGAKGDPGEQGLQGIPGAQGAHGGLVVRDSKDAVVGKVFSPNDRDFDPAGLTVVRQIGGHLVRFRVDQDGFVETPLWGFLYKSANCTGTPLFYPRHKFLPTRLFIEGTTGSYSKDMAPLAADSSKGLNVESEGECTLSGTRPCVYNRRRKTCCCNLRGTIPAVHIETTDLGTLGLVPPFRLDLP